MPVRDITPREARAEPALALLVQELLGRGSCGQRVLRQARLTEGEHETAATCNFNRIGERLGQIRKQRRHLLRRAQVLLARVAPYTSGVGEQGSVVDTHPCFV